MRTLVTYGGDIKIDEDSVMISKYGQSFRPALGEKWVFGGYAQPGWRPNDPLDFSFETGKIAVFFNEGRSEYYFSRPIREVINE
jgi:hypothetical protein